MRRGIAEPSDDPMPKITAKATEFPTYLTARPNSTVPMPHSSDKPSTEAKKRGRGKRVCERHSKVDSAALYLHQ